MSFLMGVASMHCDRTGQLSVSSVTLRHSWALTRGTLRRPRKEELGCLRSVLRGPPKACNRLGFCVSFLGPSRVGQGLKHFVREGHFEVRVRTMTDGPNGEVTKIGIGSVGIWL